MMLSVSLRPIPIDFEWNECGVNVMVRVCLMDIERGREWIRVDGWCQFRRVSIGAAYATGLCCVGVPVYRHEGKAHAPAAGAFSRSTTRPRIAKAQMPANCAADQRLLAARFQISPRILLKTARRRLSHVIPVDLAIC